MSLEAEDNKELAGVIVITEFRISAENNPSPGEVDKWKQFRIFP